MSKCAAVAKVESGMSKMMPPPTTTPMFAAKKLLSILWPAKIAAGFAIYQIRTSFQGLMQQQPTGLQVQMNQHFGLNWPDFGRPPWLATLSQEEYRQSKEPILACFQNWFCCPAAEGVGGGGSN